MLRRIAFLCAVLSLIVCVVPPPPTVAAADFIRYLPLVVSPDRFTLSKTSIFRPSQYTWEGFGDVYNLSESQAVSVTLDVQLRDSTHIITQTVQTALVATLPHQFNPYTFGFGGFNSEPYTIVTKVTIHAFSILPVGMYQSLVVISQPLICDISSNSRYIQGIVYNSGTVALHSIKLVAWANEPSYSYMSTMFLGTMPLQPGGTRPFTLVRIPVCSNLGTFHIVAQGVRDS